MLFNVLMNDLDEGIEYPLGSLQMTDERRADGCVAIQRDHNKWRTGQREHTEVQHREMASPAAGKE